MDLSDAMAMLEAEGFRVDAVYPADGPRVAEMSGNGLTLEVRTDTAPDEPADDSADIVVTNGGAWGVGRAGMQYRDLIPGRLGGAAIASHIRIAEDGPVPDVIHHHDIEFQMIYCRRGRVRLVYEDQGEPFWMEAGDCVLQPPHIRHRVLESAESLEVVEIAMPSEHPTRIDHDLDLPTNDVLPDRDFGGQRFSFDQGSTLPWTEIAPGWVERSYGIDEATSGLARVRALRTDTADAELGATHDGRLCLFYVVDGEGVLEAGGEQHQLTSDSSVSVPAGTAWTLRAVSGTFELLHIDVGGAGQ